MKRVTGSVALLLMVSACGGGGSSNSLNEGIGSTANYKGTFNATIKSGPGYTHTWADDGSPYEGGEFDGTVEATADFEADQIELTMKANPKDRVVTTFETSTMYGTIDSNGEFFGLNDSRVFVNGVDVAHANGTPAENIDVSQFTNFEGNISENKHEISGSFFTPYNDNFDSYINHYDINGTFEASH